MGAHIRAGWRRLALVAFDLAATVVTPFVALLIRFALDGVLPIPERYIDVLLQDTPIILGSRLLIYSACGLYRQVWQYASVPELVRVVGAVTLDSAAWAAVIYILPNQGFPRSVFIISWFLNITALGGIRLGLRIRNEWFAFVRRNQQGTRRTLIIGAGAAGALLAKEYAKHPELDSVLIGFLDDDPSKQGLHVAGLPVIGTRDDLDWVVPKYKVTNLVIAMPSAKGTVVRQVVEAGRRLGLHVQTVPGIYELVDGSLSIGQVRDVQIEDLLGREEVKVDLEAIAAYLTHEVVLVTGAGGSIGSELCRQVARFHPRQLLLLGHGENSIYEIHLELRTRFPYLDLRPIIADVQDETRIRQVFDRYRPSVVFHAAAHKHVPLMEENPTEAIKNNIFGTLNVAKTADQFGAKRFVLISTDKAVNPTSVMGVTKRVAECIVQSLNDQSRTVFVAVRFGNVLGSRGSVIPLFKRQIAAGGPVTVTHPDMARYFMTIPEAVQLVIQAASMGQGGEVFVLDMGEPVKIVDLARDLIRLSGYEPDVDIPIVFTGIRPGEKLSEELLTAKEGTEATRHERIFVARSEIVDASKLSMFLSAMRSIVSTGYISNDELRAHLHHLLAAEVPDDAVKIGD